MKENTNMVSSRTVPTRPAVADEALEHLTAGGKHLDAGNVVQLDLLLRGLLGRGLLFEGLV